MAPTYRLSLEKVAIGFRGDETRQLTVFLYVDGDFEDSVVIQKEDILWLLGLKENQVWMPPID